MVRMSENAVWVVFLVCASTLLLSIVLAFHDVALEDRKLQKQRIELGLCPEPNGWQWSYCK